MKSICRKNKKKMKQTIRTFIAKIPLAKPLYCAVKNRCEGLRSRRAQDRLRKKQPILRQGSPECFESMPLRIDWFVTSHCNFRCSYCFRAGREYEKIFCTLEQVETAVKHLASANRPAYQVNLIGGEPTTHPHLAEIITLLCHYLGDRLEQLVITTNGSFSESQMEAILKASELVKMNLYISIHLEYMNVERVVELVKRYSSRTSLHIILLFHPEMVDKATTVADALCDLRRDYPFDHSVNMLREPPDFDMLDSRYTQEHFNWKEKLMERLRKIKAEGPKMPENQQKIICQKFFVERNVNDSIVLEPRLSVSELGKRTGFRFTGMTCCAGTNVVRIRADGRVSGMVCGLDRPKYNIFEENPYLREDWIHGVQCTKNRCGCNINYRIPKFRSPAEAEKFIAEKKRLQKKLMGNN